VDNGHFLNVRWYDQQRSTVRQSKLKSLILNQGWGHGRPQKFFQGDNLDIFLILFILLTIEYKRRFTKRFALCTSQWKCPMLRQQSQKSHFFGAAMLLFHSCFFSHNAKLRSVLLSAVTVSQIYCQRCLRSIIKITYVAKRLLPKLEVNLWRFVAMLLLRNKDQRSNYLLTSSVTRVARLAFLTPNLTNLVFLEGIWVTKIVWFFLFNIWLFGGSWPITIKLVSWHFKYFAEKCY